jgi:2-polyprenyl-3-methyl-5-hydroxy-6-metoxy-1,4-benzoquinol methylase
MISALKRRLRTTILPTRELLELVPPASRLLDLGCGQGQFLKAIAKSRSPDALGGLEVGEWLIESARKELATVTKVPVQLSVYNGSTLPPSVSDYTFVSMIDVLHHIPSIKQAVFLGELLRAMAPGAFLLLKDIDAGRRVLCLANKFHDLLLSREVGSERSIGWAETTLKATGFTVLLRGHRRIFLYPHYWLFAVKPGGTNSGHSEADLHHASPGLDRRLAHLPSKMVNGRSTSQMPMP